MRVLNGVDVSEYWSKIFKKYTYWIIVIKKKNWRGLSLMQSTLCLIPYYKDLFVILCERKFAWCEDIGPQARLSLFPLPSLAAKLRREIWTRQPLSCNSYKTSTSCFLKHTLFSSFISLDSRGCGLLQPWWWWPYFLLSKTHLIPFQREPRFAWPWAAVSWFKSVTLMVVAVAGIILLNYSTNTDTTAEISTIISLYFIYACEFFYKK